MILPPKAKQRVHMLWDTLNTVVETGWLWNWPSIYIWYPLSFRYIILPASNHRYQSVLNAAIIYWGLNKLVANKQTTVWDAFSGKKMLILIYIYIYIYIKVPLMYFRDTLPNQHWSKCQCITTTVGCISGNAYTITRRMQYSSLTWILMHTESCYKTPYVSYININISTITNVESAWPVM